MGRAPDFRGRPRWQVQRSRSTMKPMAFELGDSSPAPAPVAMLTVAAVARRLGVAPATLRTWDRRYGLGPSEHTSGAHRRYGPSDLARLEAMRRLTRAGVAPAEAARVATASVTAAATAPLPGAPDGPRGVSAALAADRRGVLGADPAAVVASDFAAAGARPGGGRVIAMPSGSAAARGLGRAAMALDSAAATTIVGDALTSSGMVWTWEQVVMPVLEGIGRRWEATGDGIEVEHLLSECVIWAIGRTRPVVEHPVNARPVLLAAAEDELHTLPLFALSGALAERRISSRVLGARLPAAALADAVRRSGPAAVLIWSQQPTTADPRAIDTLPSLRPAPTVVVAGPGWAHPPTGTVMATDLTHAADLIAVAVGA